MADADVTMRAVWQGEQLKRGIDQGKAQIRSIKSTVAEFSSFAKGALGFGGVLVAVNDIKSAMTDLANEQKVMGGLRRSLARVGIEGEDAFKGINRELVRLRENSLFGDTEIAQGLQNLISLTGDYEGSVKNLGLALDIAADRDKSLAESTKLVAFAMKGVAEPLSEISPDLRLWAQANREILKSGEGIPILMQKMRDQFGGSAAAQNTGLVGDTKQLSEGFNELRDSLIEFAMVSGGKGPGNNLSQLAEQVRESDYIWIPGFGKFPRAEFLKREFSGALSALQSWTQDIQNIRQGIGPASAPFPSMDQLQAGVPSAPFPSMGQLQSGGGTGDAMAASSRLTDQLYAQGNYIRSIEESERKILKIRESGQLPAMEKITDLQGTGAQLARESAMQTQQMANYLGAQFTNVFFDIENGWKQMLENMARMLVQSALSKFFLGMLTGGAGAAAGGSSAAQVTSGGFMGIPFFAGSSYGATGATQQAMGWRMQRNG